MDITKKDLKPLKVFLAQPRGFCAGVERAIEIVERALKIYGPPVYVRHEIVHNKRVVNNLSSKGAIFVQELDQIPPGAVTIFSAHGVAQKIEDTAKEPREDASRELKKDIKADLLNTLTDVSGVSDKVARTLMDQFH